MPSIFQLSGPFGAQTVEYPLVPIAATMPPPKKYGSRFIRTYQPRQFGGLGMGVLPSFSTLLLMGASAAAGAFGYHWWTKRKRRR